MMSEQPAEGPSGGDPYSKSQWLDLMQQGGSGMEVTEDYEEPEHADQVSTASSSGGKK